MNKYIQAATRPSNDQIWAADVTQQIQAYQDSHPYLPSGTVYDMINQRYTGQMNDANFARIQNANSDLAGIIQEGVNIRTKIDAGNFNDNPVVLPNYSGSSGEREDQLFGKINGVDVNQIATSPDGRVLVPGGQSTGGSFSPHTGPEASTGFTGYVGADGQKYNYVGTDFKPGTFGSGPYTNPFNKESMDALDPSVRDELLNRQDAVGEEMRRIYYGDQSSTGKGSTTPATTGTIWAPTTTETDTKKTTSDTKKTTADTKKTKETVTTGVTGAVGGSVGLMQLNNETITGIVSRINECVEAIENEWKSILNNEISKINNSWAAAEAKTYVDKVMNAGNKIKNVESGIKLLGQTYQKVNITSGETSQGVNKAVSQI